MSESPSSYAAKASGSGLSGTESRIRSTCKGATVETTDVKRVNSLIKRGLAEIVSIEEINDGGKVEDGGAAGNGGDNTQKTDPSKVLFDGKEYEPQTFKEALVGIGVTCAPSIGVNGLTKKIGDLTEDQKKALAEKLVNE